MEVRGQTIQTDSTRWPLVMIRFLGEITEDEFDQYLRFLDFNVARTGAARAKIALLFDAREVGRVSPAIRRKQADWIRDNLDISRQNCAGFAYVLDSSMVRGMLTAILWLATMPADYTITATVREAEDWLKGQLAGHGLVVNAPMLSIPPRAPKADRR